MGRKAEIRAKIVSNNFTRKDYHAFKTNMRIVQARYHPDLTAGVDMPEAITQMAEDSSSLKAMVIINIVLPIIMFPAGRIGELLTSLIAVNIAFFAVLWSNAKERNLSLMTEFRLIKLAARMKKIIKIRAREEKARIKAEKNKRRR